MAAGCVVVAGCCTVSASCLSGSGGGVEEVAEVAMHCGGSLP